MIEYALLSAAAGVRNLTQALPGFIQRLDNTFVMGVAAVVLVLAFTLSSRTRH
jgi:hypothetical protein